MQRDNCSTDDGGVESTGGFTERRGASRFYRVNARYINVPASCAVWFFTILIALFIDDASHPRWIDMTDHRGVSSGTLRTPAQFSPSSAKPCM